MIIQFLNEFDLQEKIKDILNQTRGMNFEVPEHNYFCDIRNREHTIFIEVKPEGFAPHQLLYGLYRGGIEDAHYVGLANSFILRLYEPPDWSDLEAFALRVDPDLLIMPSAVPDRFREEAFELLGEHKNYLYEGQFDIARLQKFIFVNDRNLPYLKEHIFDKYNINIYDFFSKFAQVTLDVRAKIDVLRDRRRIMDNIGPNIVKAGEIINNIFDITLIEHLRVKAEDIEKILKLLEEIYGISELGETLAEVVLDVTNPTFILEPFVGTAGLIRPIVEHKKGVMNDIKADAIELLKTDFEGYEEWSYYGKDFLATSTEEIKNEWCNELRDTDTFLIYSNPPFKGERNDLYQYLYDDYGSANYALPAVGKMINVIESMLSKYAVGYLAFFCPMSLFCERNRLRKPVDKLLKDFKFKKGYIYSGKYFKDVTKDKPIAFSIWKYKPNHNIDHETIFFDWNGEEKHFKRFRLLKDGWKYDVRERNGVTGEIVIQAADRFYIGNSGRFFYIHGTENRIPNGSELLSDYVKIDLGLEIPSELFYGLWSRVVGSHSNIIDLPIIFDNSLIHLPDLGNIKTKEILAYAVLHATYENIKGNYAGDRIGFVGVRRVFKFGQNNSITVGAKYLIETFEDCPIGTRTIGEVFDYLKNLIDIDNIDNTITPLIKKEISNRLNEIGYWDYLPLPLRQE